MTAYPIPGRCGACHLPAEQYPSGRWSHTGRHCNQGAGWHHDLLIPKPPYVFVPDGQPLPVSPKAGAMVVSRVNETGFPVELAWLPPEGIARLWARWREQALSVDGEVLGSTTFAGEVSA